jgi:hypothetical protein
MEPVITSMKPRTGGLDVGWFGFIA